MVAQYWGHVFGAKVLGVDGIGGQGNGARYWGHVFGCTVLRVDGIGGQGSGGTVLRARYCGQSIKSRRYWGTG